MRKSKPKKRIILPDPRFNDTMVTRFVNNMMYDGKNLPHTLYSTTQLILLKRKPAKAV